MLNLEVRYKNFKTNCFIFAKNILNLFTMNALVTILGPIGPWQIALIVGALLLLFGGKKIPELMKGLGSGIKEFKDATKEENAKKDESSKTDSDNK